MMRYGFSGTCSSFTTAGGGPAGGHAWRRAPPLQAPSAMTMLPKTTIRVVRATCMGLPSLSAGVGPVIGQRVVRGRAAREPVAERGRVLGQAPLFEDRQRHRAHAAVTRAGGQALLVQPLLEPVGVGVGSDGPLEQLALDRQADGVRRRVASAAPALPLRRLERGEQLAADFAGARAHAAPPGGGRWTSWSSLHHPPPTSM